MSQYKFIATLVVLLVMGSNARTEQPDPVALLRGVQQSRQALHGRLSVSVVLKDIKPPRKDGGRELDIEFDKGLRRFVQHQTVLAITGKDADEKSRKFHSLGGDLDAGVKAGLGTAERWRTLTVFDGNQVASFRESSGCAIHKPEVNTPQFCFDFRIFGISRSHTHDYRLDSCLGLDNHGVPVLVGQEQLNGQQVWHVKVSFPKFGVDYHYWIEDSQGFRVHRYEYKYPSDGSDIHVVSASDYGTNPVRPPLPKRVFITETSSGVVTEKEFSVTSADYSVTPDLNLFTLKGLEIPPGTMVIDERVSRVAGYWTGEGLSDSYTEAKATGAKLAAKEEEVRWENAYRRWLQIGVGVLLILVVAVVAYKRFAARRPTQPPAAI